MRNGGLNFASADGVLNTINNDSPGVGEGISPITQITPFGGSSVSTSGDTIGALPFTGNSVSTVPNTAVDNIGAIPGTPDTSASLISSNPGTDLAYVGTTSSSNFNPAQIENYSQGAQGTTQTASTPSEGVSFGLNNGLRPEVTYTNQGGSTFSLGPTTSVTNMLGNLGNLGSSLNGFQAGFNIGLRKLKRSLANAFN